MRSPERIPLVDGTELRLLHRTDAAAIRSLKLANRDRLTRFGDWTIPADYSVADVERELDDGTYEKLSYGIWDGERLLGVAAITAVTAESWSIGYFLDESVLHPVLDPSGTVNEAEPCFYLRVGDAVGNSLTPFLVRTGSYSSVEAASQVASELLGGTIRWDSSA